MGRWGSLPMNGQVSCEGPLGKSSLKDPLGLNHTSAFRKDDLKPQVDPATVKKAMGY